MRIRTICPVCFSRLFARRAGPDEVREFRSKRLEATITHERFAAVTCEAGHSFSIGTGEPVYALLYERALQRFVDGDYRDSLLDAYTALDMYMPTVPVRARYDSDPRLGVADLEGLRKEFKSVTKDATSALAAALTAVSIRTGLPPPSFDTKLAVLRNRAVHAGQYPTGEDTEWAVLEVERIVTTIDDMLTNAAPRPEPEVSRSCRLD